MPFKTKAWVAILSGALAACGGGGGSTSTTTIGGSNVRGLEMASTMSVIAANESTTRSATRAAGSTRAYNDSWTDYTNDPVNTYVYDESMESLSTVNDILCMMAQTKAHEMVNRGDYVALIDQGLCDQGENNGQTAGGSSSGRQTEYERWVVNSSRTSAEAPQIVKIWVPQNEPNRGPSTIFGHFTVTEAVTSANRFGKFVGNFAQVAQDGSVQMHGTLKTVDAINGKVAYTFYAGDPSGTVFREAASVVMDPDGRAGVAETHRYFDEPGPTPASSVFYGLAFDGTHVLRHEGAAEADIYGASPTRACLSRTTFDTTVWRYGLYRRYSGARVDVYSGFPIRYDNNGTAVNGYIGYWGLWLEDPAVQISDGALVTKREYGSAAATQYSVMRKPGKLIKSTRATLNVTSALVGQELRYWGALPSNPTATNGEWRVEVTAVSTGNIPTFTITHEITGYTESGPTLRDVADETLTPPVGGALSFWSEGLGGRTNYKDGDTLLTYYYEEFVQPDDALFANSDAAVTLKCYQRCLKGQINDVSAEGPFLTDATAATPYRYTIDRVGMTLESTVATNLGVVEPIVSTANTPHAWGMQSGNMVLDSVNITDPVQVVDQPVTYRWETGENDWNKFTAVKNATTGALEVFERPLQFSYTHSNSNDVNGTSLYSGKTYRLNYGGFGQLWGIPWVQGVQRFSPQFSIVDGTAVGPNGNEYVVKALDKEQRMRPALLSACGALAVNRPAAPLPTAVDGTPDIGAMPVLTAAPAVIAGELQ